MVSAPVVDVLLGSGALDVSHVALQGAESVEQGPSTGQNTELTVVLVLVVGALLIAGKPVYVNRVVRDVRDEPIGCFAWGIVTLVVFGALIFALLITVVGALVAIPLILVFAVLAAGGNVLAYLALLENTIGNRWLSLLVATLAIVLVSLFGAIGSIVNFVVGSIGIGAMVRRWMSR